MDDIKAEISSMIAESVKVHEAMNGSERLKESLAALAIKCAKCLKSGGKILFAGNGGSAADSQHLAAELVNRFMLNRKALAALALTTDTSVLTSIGNDAGFADIFARQVEALGNKGDILIVLSTSGTSPNVKSAVDCARNKGMYTAAFTGAAGGPLTEKCDRVISIPSHSTPRIQEGHILAGHILCGLIEEAML
jgi:D-sedoheptulose 7-phosphate isomerase